MNRGGAELRTLEVVRQFPADAFTFHYCALSGKPGLLDDEIRAMGGDVFPCALDRTFPARFSRLLREGHYDVVHSHVYTFSGALLWLAARAGVPTRIAHFRSTGDGRRPTPLRRLQHAVFRGLIRRYATAILAVSEGAMTEAWHPAWHDDPRCRVIYNGLDTAPYAGPVEREAVLREFELPANGTLVIHVGRMDPAKNHPRLAAIFAALAARRPEASLLLVGRGGNAVEAAFRQRAEALGIAARVRYAGERRDVPRLLKAADLKLLPSLREGLPGSVLEALIAATPVVSSDVPGAVEIARHLPGVRTLSLQASDDAWVDAACALLDAAPLRKADPAWLDTFAQSAFGLPGCCAVFADAWQGRAR